MSVNRLATLLSIIAGMVDITGFLTMGHLLTAHVTGNLVLLSADIAREGTARAVQIAIVPVFMVAVAAAWGVAQTATRKGLSATQALLWIQFLLLFAVLGLCTMRNTGGEPWDAVALIAVFAMGCQFALLRIALPGSPSTAAMTGNVTDVVLSLLNMLSRDPSSNNGSRERLQRSAQVLLGFLGGCLIAALAVKLVRELAWALPTALALLAVRMAPRPIIAVRIGPGG